MTRQKFKKVMDDLRQIVMRNKKMVDSLESIGLTVNGESSESGMDSLYGVQSMAADVVMDALGITSEAEREWVLPAIDGYLHQEIEYEKFLFMLEQGGIALPWNDIVLYEDGPYVKHRGISIKHGKPVVGYVWAGADHVYITPDNFGIDYDDDTGRITACAIEVIAETVAAQLPLMDDEYTQLYAGDVVNADGRLVTLKPFDKEVMELLSMPEYRKRTHRVKANYEK